MKKILCMLLVILCLGSFSFAASDISIEDINTILSGMDIVDSDFYLKGSINRAELAEILVRASTSANLGKAVIRLSTFPDVPYTAENASYIRIAAINGYLTAYTDGEFKPNNVVKNEEAITSMLKLLGYKSSDFNGSYPYTQLMIAEGLKITDGVDTTVGVEITGKNLERLLYNTLNCSVKGSNQKYVNTLGYSVSDDITLSDVMVKNVAGPVTYLSGSSLFELTGISDPTVYIDGKLSSKEDLAAYDVLYYSENSKIIWAYTSKVTGMVESISPNREAPTQVSISGKNYKLSSYSARKAFGVNGKISVGNMATLLLDRNGEVSDAYLTEDLYAEQVGVIINSGKKSLMTTSGTSKTSYYAQVLLSTGEKIEIATNNDYSSKVGYAAKVSYKNGKVSIYSTSKSTETYGRFSLEDKTLGKEKISESVKILETDDFGNVVTVYPNRLDGIILNKGQVIFVDKNNNGVITSMIIKNVTGDTGKYGILTDINTRMDGESYTCIVDGSEKNYSNSDITFNVEAGPVALFMDGNELGRIKNLTKVTGGITNINSSYLEKTDGTQIKVSNDVCVYYKNNGNYYLYTMDDVVSGEYSVNAYIDDITDTVRVIILS